MSFLGIDLGTSGLRLLLIGDDGAPLASAEQSYPTARPQPGWSEQDPADWTEALDRAIAELRSKAPQFARLKGIAVSGHMHGATLLDQSGKVLRPCMLWNDTRSGDQAAVLDGDPLFRGLSGNIVFAGFTAPKLRWVQENEPEVFAKTAKVLLPAAYLNHHLTGIFATDMSDASGTAWLDLRARRWSEPLLTASGMRADQMPELSEGNAPIGMLKPEICRRWGVAGDICVAGGAGDNAAAACGIGALGEGEGFVSLGTSGVLLLARGSCQPAPETALHTFCHAVPERWYQMGVMLSATDALNWFAQITGKTPAELTSALGAQLQPPSGAVFLPYLAGERTPHNDAGARGAFIGLSLAEGRASLTRAVLEGVAFGLRDSAEAMTSTGARLTELYAIGGGAASDYWLKLIATVLGVTLLRPTGGAFGAALGAARLAMSAATGAPLDDIMSAPADCDRFEPEQPLVESFDAAYSRFRAAYPALRPLS